jgi:CDP-glucose 4,6-dehydratase
VRLASARAGNVIGGGDWALDRLVPDCIRSLQRGDPIPVRNRRATRPWQHVLDPLSGYLWLAARLSAADSPHVASAFNFGPDPASNQPVSALVEEVLKHWPGRWEDRSEPGAAHEAALLSLAIDKAHRLLDWKPGWDFATAVENTVQWYRFVAEDAASAGTHTRRQIARYEARAQALKLAWAHE